jgi:hypothetical protein
MSKRTFAHDLSAQRTFFRKDNWPHMARASVFSWAATDVGNGAFPEFVEQSPGLREVGNDFFRPDTPAWSAPGRDSILVSESVIPREDGESDLLEPLSPDERD